MDTYLREKRSDPKFTPFCDNYGVKLLDFGWTLYCDDNGINIDQLKSSLIKENETKLEYEVQRALKEKEQLISELRLQQQQIKMESQIQQQQLKVESRLELQQLKSENMDTIGRLKELELENQRLKNSAELKSKNEIEELKLVIEKLKNSETERLNATKLEIQKLKDSEIEELKLVIEKLKKSETERLTAMKLEIEKLKDFEIERIRIENKHELEKIDMINKQKEEQMKLIKDNEVQAVKSQYELAMQKYATDVTASFTKLTTENEQLKTLTPVAEMMDRLHNSKGANSTLKGTAGQSLIEVILADSYYAGAKITPCDKTPHSCDLEFIWHVLKAKIEIKNYGRGVNRDEVQKFREDMKRSKAAGFNCGIFVSVDQPVMGEYNSLGYQWLDGMLLIYFNLGNEAVNMRYVINLAMIVLENYNGGEDEDEKVLIDSFKENYLTVQSSIEINEKMTKQMLGSLKLLEAERIRLFGLKDKMCKIGGRWIGGGADIAVSDSDVKVAVGSDPFTSAYEYILKNGGGDINPRPAIAKFCAGASDFDIEVMLNKMVDKAVFASLLSGTFEYFHGQGVGYITHGMLDGLSFPGKGKALNKKNYSLIKNFGCKSLDGVMQCYERWKRWIDERPKLKI